LLSFHLKTLKEAGIVRDRRQGRWVYYSLNPATFDEMAEFIRGLKPVGPGSANINPRCCD